MNATFYKILPSGITIVHRQTASPVVYTGIMVGAGTRDEQPEENGMAHYIEHCLFKGCEHTTSSKTKSTQTYNSRQIIERVEGIGGEINAYTTKEDTVFYAAAPKEYFSRTLGILADMVFRPTFPKTETDKEVGVILEEIESYNDSPSDLIYDDFENILFDGNPLAFPILGSKKTLKHISSKPSYAKEWMKKHYRPERMVVFSQGNLTFQQVLPIVERVVEPLASVDRVSIECRLSVDRPTIDPRLTPDVGSVRQVSYKKHTHQAHVMLGGRAYEIGNRKQLGLYLLNHLLGGGSMSSRLNMSLREKNGWVYTIDSQISALSDCGYWSIYFASDPKMKDQCLDQCQKELRRLREQPLSSSMLHKILRQIKGILAISDENQENKAITMARKTLYQGYAPTWQETFSKLGTVTPQEIQSIANEIYSEDNQWLLMYE